MLNKGDVVEVFEDPMTRKIKEGNARVVEHVARLDTGLDLCLVNFIGDDPRTIVQRQVLDVGAGVTVHWVQSGSGVRE